MLTPYRVLDLSDQRGELTGFILAQLGAEVIAIEPPGGSTSRTMAPFTNDAPGLENSLRYKAYNRGKSSVVLDIARDQEDRDRLRALAAGADVLIESADVGVMAELGLGYDELKSVNPALVYVSISAFGQTGPKANWAATDLVAWAAAGPAYLTGNSDRAPLRMPNEQSYMHASAEAAGAAIAALIERSSSGLGQHIDAAGQHASTQATQSMTLSVANGDAPLAREAGGLMLHGIFLQLLWPCADGHVSVTFLFGTALGVPTRRLMEQIYREGFCDEATRDKDWIAYGEMLIGGTEPIEEFDRVKAIVGDFCMAHTKAELLELATSLNLLIAPVNMLNDVVELDQLAEREFFDDVDGVRYPGPMAKLSGTPLARLGAAPKLGADTERVLNESPRAVDAPTPTGPVPTNRPLEGLKVLDLMWVMAGPAGTRVLADLGATVVRVESGARVDTARTLQPFKDSENSLESSMLFANMNAGKLGMTVNPTTDEGKAVIHDLIRWADVVTESFSPKAMTAWGLDYESIRKVNPRVVMLSSCLFGQTGPLALFAGYGTMAAAMSGFFGVTGWPDRAPSGPMGAYTDYISPRFANAALLAAVDHQRRTGEGQYVDFAQAEGALHVLAPQVLDYTVNGRVTTPQGNSDERHHPHGLFQVQGDDQWVAIACADDAQRAALASTVGSLDDAAITAWAAAHTADAAVDVLQAGGVPAHIANHATSMLEDPQLSHRGYFAPVAHASLGSVTVEGPKTLFSRTPAVAGPVPTLGQHNTEILTEILGYTDERMVELLISGSLE